MNFICIAVSLLAVACFSMSKTERRYTFPCKMRLNYYDFYFESEHMNYIISGCYFEDLFWCKNGGLFLA